MTSDVKNCPFCGEEILAIAIKCKHCKSDLQVVGIDDPEEDAIVQPKSGSGLGAIILAGSVFGFIALMEILPAIFTETDEEIAERMQSEAEQRGIETQQQLVAETTSIRLAADQGDAVMQNDLGMRFFNGYGVPKDFIEAVKWFRLAASQGDAPAQYNLGAMYNNGDGVTQDGDAAETWYQRAADQGYEPAQEQLSIRQFLESYNLTNADIDILISANGSFTNVLELANNVQEDNVSVGVYLSEMVAEERCKTDWEACKNNSDFVNVNASKFDSLQSECRFAGLTRANEMRLEVDWGSYMRNFGSFRTGTSVLDAGTLILIDNEAKAENRFGAQVPMTSTCWINVESEEVTRLVIEDA